MSRSRKRNVTKADYLLHSAIDVDQVILAEIECLRQNLPQDSGLEAGLGRIEDRTIKNSKLLQSAKNELGTRLLDLGEASSDLVPKTPRTRVRSISQLM